MIETLNPCTNTAKTAEIMSKYRPIAPRPETPSNSTNMDSTLSQRIKQSLYIRNLWPQLQARPTRTRKRGRGTIALPSLKRQKAHVLRSCSPCHVTSAAKNISLQSFISTLPQLPLPYHGLLNCSLEKPTSNPSLVTLPLLPCSFPAPIVTEQPVTPEPDLKKPGTQEIIDLNTTASIPEEKDLLKQLQAPVVSNLIAPKPVRPVGSSILVGRISEDPSLLPKTQAPKKPEEVEEDVESQLLPAVISDSNNKVRMVNSAYKEMVGQPECPWLDSMDTSNGQVRCGSCRRISGQVTLNLCDSNIPISSNRFSCWVKIEWKSDDRKISVNAFCDVIRLSCEYKDYHFTWRFHTRNREPYESSRYV